MIIEPTKKLLQVWNTIPNAPKVVIWAPIVEWWDVYKVLLQELDRYPNLKFNFKGKPLILNTTDTSRYSTDSNAIEELNRTMTVRDVWALNWIWTKYWETFKSQFSSVFANPWIDTVLISSWNEWASIRLQNIFDTSKAAYTDTFNEDKNRDIEPQDWWKWDFYYQLMKKCISSYKQWRNSCE